MKVKPATEVYQLSRWGKIFIVSLMTSPIFLPFQFRLPIKPVVISSTGEIQLKLFSVNSRNKEYSSVNNVSRALVKLNFKLWFLPSIISKAPSRFAYLGLLFVIVK